MRPTTPPPPGSPIDVDSTTSLEPLEAAAVPPGSLELRRPTVPTTIAQLAMLKGEAIETMQLRAQVWEKAVTAAILATHPTDYVLFRDREGRVIAYLQDSGCERARNILGIEIFNVGTPQKIPGTAPGEFSYVISGWGRCHLTLQVVEAMEGGRGSLEDFCKGKSGAALELDVRKAARANLDGNIVRELSGLRNLPIEVLEQTWAGTTKRVDQCRKGRGFGTFAEREGVATTTPGTPKIEAPTCGYCGAQAQYKPAGVSASGRAYEAFWRCPAKQQKHPETNWTLDDAQWRRELAQRAAKAETERQPGEEG